MEQPEMMCSYVDCGEPISGILMINTQGGFTVPMPMCAKHTDYQGKLVSITYMENRLPQFQVEYLPDDVEAKIAAVLDALYDEAEHGPSNRRGVWRRMWANERRERGHVYDIMADVLFGLGVPFMDQSPLALPHQLRPRLTKLWANRLKESPEEVGMMLDGTVRWLTDRNT